MINLSIILYHKKLLGGKNYRSKIAYIRKTLRANSEGDLLLELVIGIVCTPLRGKPTT